MINVLGLAAYFAIRNLASSSDFQQTDTQLIRQWLFPQLPLLAFCFGVNITWLVMSRKNGWLNGMKLLLWISICLLWGLILVHDPINGRGFSAMLSGRAWP